jgi:hypothetical protein
MKDTPTTIDDLARMINEGFKATATKEDITQVNARLNRIETLLQAKQEQRIAALEARMKQLEAALAV